MVHKRRLDSGKVVVATDSSNLYGNDQPSRSAITWRANTRIMAKGPVCTVVLWVEMLQLLDAKLSKYKWTRIRSHVQVRGNKRAEVLAAQCVKGSAVAAH